MIQVIEARELPGGLIAPWVWERGDRGDKKWLLRVVGGEGDPGINRLREKRIVIFGGTHHLVFLAEIFTREGAGILIQGGIREKRPDALRRRKESL